MALFAFNKKRRMKMSNRYVVLMHMGGSNWVKVYGPTDFNTANWYCTTQRKETRVELA